MFKKYAKIKYLISGTVFFDTTLTLIGQNNLSGENIGDINEINPLGYFLLSINNLAFFLFIIPYLLVIFLVINKLPKKLTPIFILTVIIGHLQGVLSWAKVISGRSPFNLNFSGQWFMLLGFWVLISIIIARVFEKELNLVIKE